MHLLLDISERNLILPDYGLYLWLSVQSSSDHVLMSPPQGGLLIAS